MQWTVLQAYRHIRPLARSIYVLRDTPVQLCLCKTILFSVVCKIGRLFICVKAVNSKKYLHHMNCRPIVELSTRLKVILLRHRQNTGKHFLPLLVQNCPFFPLVSVSPTATPFHVHQMIEPFASIQSLAACDIVIVTNTAYTCCINNNIII